MKIVYIAHRISGDVKGNTELILQIIKIMNMQFPDVVPFAPYLTDVLALDDNIPEQRERGIKNDIELFNRKVMDEVWVFGDWEHSKGVKAEIKLAEELGIPVKYKGYELTSKS